MDNLFNFYKIFNFKIEEKENYEFSEIIIFFEDILLKLGDNPKNINNFNEKKRIELWIENLKKYEINLDNSIIEKPNLYNVNNILKNLIQNKNFINKFNDYNVSINLKSNIIKDKNINIKNKKKLIENYYYDLIDYNDDNNYYDIENLKLEIKLFLIKNKKNINELNNDDSINIMKNFELNRLEIFKLINLIKKDNYERIILNKDIKTKPLDDDIINKLENIEYNKDNNNNNDNIDNIDNINKVYNNITDIKIKGKEIEFEGKLLLKIKKIINGCENQKDVIQKLESFKNEMLKKESKLKYINKEYKEYKLELDKKLVKKIKLFEEKKSKHDKKRKFYNENKLIILELKKKIKELKKKNKEILNSIESLNNSNTDLIKFNLIESNNQKSIYQLDETIDKKIVQKNNLKNWIINLLKNIIIKYYKKNAIKFPLNFEETLEKIQSQIKLINDFYNEKLKNFKDNEDSIL